MKKISPQPLSRSRGNQHGFSLLELIVAMVLLAMVTAMIYSIVNVGINFSEKGEAKILAMERKYGFLNLIHRQIKNAKYDAKKKELLITADEDMLKLVTYSPLIYQDVGLVLAVYRYNAAEQTIYYAEKRDYYNIDYGEDYVPDFDEMGALALDEEEFTASFDAAMGAEVGIRYRGEDYVFYPKCIDDEMLNLSEEGAPE